MVELATNDLVKAIKETPTYVTYINEKNRIMENPFILSLLDEYNRLDKKITSTRIAQIEPSETELSRYQQLATLLHTSDESKDFMLAKIAVQVQVGKVVQSLVKELTLLEFDI